MRREDRAVKKKKEKRGRCLNCGAPVSAWRVQLCTVCIRDLRKKLWGK